jgi:putative Mg2+ transporter-C (MgtC) family protein
MTTPLDYYDIILRMVAAVFCGGFIGLERDLRRMPTGFRTMAIVSLGACVATIAGARTGDPAAFSRIAQGVVTGIGFLGAGVILQRGHRIRNVKGLTTAAAIWLTAAIGLMCGLGELKLAIAATALAIAVLVLDFFGSRIWPKPPQSPHAEQEDDTFSSRDGD